MIKPSTVQNGGWRGSNIAALSGLLAFAAALLGACDTVQLANTSPSDNGLLIDADTSSGPDNDKGFVSAGSTINVGLNKQRSGSNEVVAFANRRPVALQGVSDWSDGAATVPVNYAGEIAIPVKVWIVKGPFDQQRQKAIDACITTLMQGRLFEEHIFMENFYTAADAAQPARRSALFKKF